MSDNSKYNFGKAGGWELWLEAIEIDGVNLTAWEEEFIESIQDKIAKYGDDTNLSDRQIEVIERIYSQRVP